MLGKSKQMRMSALPSESAYRARMSSRHVPLRRRPATQQRFAIYIIDKCEYYFALLSQTLKSVHLKSFHFIFSFCLAICPLYSLHFFCGFHAFCHVSFRFFWFLLFCVLFVLESDTRIVV